ncbi:MAG: SDR family oxidoreductase [Steroidobacteraceae bacterium]|jgi:NAD(P)-dependent dehydrogenase (short-subunit alcohol dehydrogenase family)|nr:SDR family oxidoreductase [Steroidobacteraceae bacterium]
MSTWLVTGASRGIGLELCRQLAARGDTVIAACRKATPALAATGCGIIEGVEVTDPGSLRRLDAALGDTRLDVLVNNAGILSVESLGRLDFEAMRRQFEVNALGPLRVTEALLPRLGAGSKIAIITSRMGSIADNGSGGYYGYRMSKAAVNAAGVSLARDLEGRGIAVLLLHPGMVATDMTGGTGIPPAESATMLIARIDRLGLADSGSFHHANGEVLPW